MKPLLLNANTLHAVYPVKEIKLEQQKNWVLWSSFCKFAVALHAFNAF